jgi:hypothetical protein
MFKNNKIILLVKMIGMFFIPIILILLPSDFFDEGESVCLSVLLAGIECYACGMTRAVMHLIHFDFISAWEYNKLSFVVFPILSYLYAKEFLETKAEYDRQSTTNS